MNDGFIAALESEIWVYEVIALSLTGLMTSS